QTAGPPPFLRIPPPPGPILKQAVDGARRGRLFIVGQRSVVTPTPGGVRVTLPSAKTIRKATPARVSGSPRPPGLELPGWRVTGSHHFPGYLDVNVFVLNPPSS